MGKWNEEKPKSVSQALDDLVHYVRLDLGFCDAPSAQTLLDKHARLTGEVFANEVLAAEGMQETLTEWPKELAKVFNARLGAYLEKDT